MTEAEYQQEITELQKELRKERIRNKRLESQIASMRQQEAAMAELFRGAQTTPQARRIHAERTSHILDLGEEKSK
jgi:hypothetical protein